MRRIEEIRHDVMVSNLADGSRTTDDRRWSAKMKLIRDVPDLLDEVERLRAALAEIGDDEDG